MVRLSKEAIRALYEKKQRDISLNEFQRTAAKCYGDGDFAHCADLAEAQEVGDGLFSFIMRELANDGSAPMDAETARGRMRSAIRDIEHVLQAI